MNPALGLARTPRSATRLLAAAALVTAGSPLVLLGGPTATATPASSRAADDTCTTSGATRTCSFAATGGEQTFVVPAGVTHVRVTATGAPARAAAAPGRPSTEPSTKPARAAATPAEQVSGRIAVTPARTLYVEVGTPATSTGPGYDAGDTDVRSTAYAADPGATRLIGATGATDGTEPAGATPAHRPSKVPTGGTRTTTTAAPGVTISYHLTEAPAALATPTLTTRATSGTAGGTITDTATVSGGANPTGTVTFAVYGPRQTSCTGTPRATSTVPLTNGTATSTTYTAPKAGAYRWVATYSGDTGNSPVSGACNAAGETSTVAADPAAVATTSVLTASPDSPTRTGKKVVLTLKVTSAGAPVIGGTVTFTTGSTKIGGCTRLSNTTGTVTCTIATLPVGKQKITGAFTGTAAVKDSEDSLSYTIAAKHRTTTTLTTSPAATATRGSSVTLGVTVVRSGTPLSRSTTAPRVSTDGLLSAAALTPTAPTAARPAAAAASAASARPTGTVTITAGGRAIKGCTGLTVARGSAGCTTTALPLGTSSLVATYSGDADNAVSTATLSFDVVAPGAAGTTTLGTTGVTGLTAGGTTTPGAPGTALPDTGNQVTPGLLGGGVAMLLTGLGLVLVGRSRRLLGARG